MYDGLNLEKVSGDRSGKNALFANARSRALFPAVVPSWIFWTGRLYQQIFAYQNVERQQESCSEFCAQNIYTLTRLFCSEMQ